MPHVPHAPSCRLAPEWAWVRRCRYSSRQRAQATSGARCCLLCSRYRAPSAGSPRSAAAPKLPRPAEEHYRFAHCSRAMSARSSSPTKRPHDAAASKRRRQLHDRIFFLPRVFLETRSDAHRSARHQYCPAPPESSRLALEWWRSECGSCNRHDRPRWRSHHDHSLHPQRPLDNDDRRLNFNHHRCLHGNFQHIQRLRSKAFRYDGVTNLHVRDRVDTGQRMRALTSECNFHAAATLFEGQAVIAILQRGGAGRASLRWREGFTDGPCLGIAHRDVMILLRVHADQFFVLVVLEHELVVAVMPLGRVGLQSGLGLVAGKRIGMLVVAIVHASCHKRPIGITFEELDHDLHPNPRNELLAPLLAGPGLGNPDRARFFRLAIPMELDPDVTVFVGRYLLVVVALLLVLGNDFRGLDTVDARFWCQRQTPERAIARQELVVSVVASPTR